MGTIFKVLEVVDKLKKGKKNKRKGEFKDILSDEVKELDKELTEKKK
ncbi:hypothetical protein GKZ28_24625 [Clostridium chromiireducens]|uniref:Uncharacterized protein n=1 Tax=Clostridium chromiireducens TaxID=225345 RepID=A0A964W4Y0_9CLOT|nr:hypothetical protein [Clostridium chromiireducens]MVX66849.1 hypothetical protein [Clostridium chromiireducens]